MPIWVLLMLFAAFFTGIAAAFFLTWKIFLFIMVIWILLSGMLSVVARLEDTDFFRIFAGTIILIGTPFFIMGWVTELLIYLFVM